MPSDPQSDPSELNTAGFFIVGVLAFCFILIPVIAVFAQSSKVVARSTQAKNERFKIEFLADGLAEALASRLTSDRTLADRFREAATMECQFEEALFSFRIQDHDGKIDINNASSELLKIGFKVAGFSEDNAILMQQYTEAYRSNGVTPDTESALAALPSLKHAPFERIEELNDAVAALKSPPIDFEPFFTVYKRKGGVEYDTATKAMKAGIDAAPEIAQHTTDNGGFDYIDVAVMVSRNGRRHASLKTYARLPILGEVREIASKDLPIEGSILLSRVETRRADCASLINIGKGTAADG